MHWIKACHSVIHPSQGRYLSSKKGTVCGTYFKNFTFPCCVVSACHLAKNIWNGECAAISFATADNFKMDEATEMNECGLAWRNGDIKSVGGHFANKPGKKFWWRGCHLYSFPIILLSKSAAPSHPLMESSRYSRYSGRFHEFPFLGAIRHISSTFLWLVTISSFVLFLFTNISE